MKRKIALALATVMTMSAMSLSAFADDSNVNLQLNGEAVVSDQPAVIVNGRTMVPVRVVAEALGCEVKWDANTKTAVFVKDGVEASLTIGAAVLNISDGNVTVPVEIDSPAVIINGRTMVPIRFLSDTFDCDVEWDGETKTVNVVSKYVEDVVETPAAVEKDPVSDADFLKEYAESVDKAIGVLNDKASEFTSEEKEEFEKQCDVVATVLKALSASTPMTEDEADASLKAAEAAYDSFAALAKKYGVSDEFEKAMGKYFVDNAADDEDKTADSDEDAISDQDFLKEFAEAVDKSAAVLNEISADFNDSEKADFDKQCDAVATVLKEVSSEMTDAEVKAATESLEKAVETFKTLAKTYGVSDKFEKAMGDYFVENAADDAE